MTETAIDYQKLGELSDEFTNLWNRLQAFYLDTVTGFHFIADHLHDEQSKARGFVQGSELDSEEFQDTRMFSYDGIFLDEFCTSGIHHATQGEVKARNIQEGENYITLGQLCLTAFYDFWEDYLRKEYVTAKGCYDPKNHDKCLHEHARHDLWGDLRHMRQSIVHHRGVATDEVKNCRRIKWFQPGDKIVITPDRMRAIFLGLLAYRNELNAEQFPPTTIILGG